MAKRAESAADRVLRLIDKLGRLVRVLSLGAGVQSTTLLLMSLRGELPRLDAAVFADTQAEPKAVYRHLEWLKSLCGHAGLPLHVGTAGDLRRDNIEFRRNRRVVRPDGKNTRYASIPLFVKNPDGSQGRVKRQCTKEYKIEVVDRILRRLVLGLGPRERLPRVPVVEHWFGITTDESRRMAFPGKYKTVPTDGQRLLWSIDEGGVAVQTRKRKVWVPTLWEQHAYPFIGSRLLPSRRGEPLGYLPRTYTRQDCQDWLAEHYPEREVPRSACVACPFRSNAEWRRMRDEQPDEWADAVRFDYEQRQAEDDNATASGRRGRVGPTYVHRQLLPLDLVDLGGDGEPEGTSCGMLGDGLDGGCGL
jgi:hypothetical protein